MNRRREPEYDFDWLTIPAWAIIIACILIGGSYW